jgi:hypothetical protein
MAGKAALLQPLGTQDGNAGEVTVGLGNMLGAWPVSRSGHR